MRKPRSLPCGALMPAFLLVLGLTAPAAAQSGACCRPNGTCTITISLLCFQMGGSWQGGGTSCSEVECTEPRACCFPAGMCVDVQAQACDTLGGNPQGPGTDCDTVECPQPEPKEACCFANGNCIVRAEDRCLELGGDPQGPGTRVTGPGHRHRANQAAANRARRGNSLS